jgi:hypothetical protein
MKFIFKVHQKGFTGWAIYSGMAQVVTVAVSMRPCVPTPIPPKKEKRKKLYWGIVISFTRCLCVCCAED